MPGGLLVCAAGLLWLGGCAPGTAFAQMAPPLLLIGLGIGLPWGLMDGLAVSVVPSERAGMATGIFSTVRVAGEGMALALVGAAWRHCCHGGCRHWLPHWRRRRWRPPARPRSCW